MAFNATRLALDPGERPPHIWPHDSLHHETEDRIQELEHVGAMIASEFDCLQGRLKHIKAAHDQKVVFSLLDFFEATCVARRLILRRIVRAIFTRNAIDQRLPGNFLPTLWRDPVALTANSGIRVLFLYYQHNPRISYFESAANRVCVPIVDVGVHDNIKVGSPGGDLFRPVLAAVTGMANRIGCAEFIPLFLGLAPSISDSEIITAGFLSTTGRFTKLSA